MSVDQEQIKNYSHTEDKFQSNAVTPKISLIVPVLNEEKILQNSLKIYTNEIKQKYNLELIVSDGGSNDRTIEIAKQYADKIVIHNQVNRQTIAEGRNCGAEVAEGETLVFINGDTIPMNIHNFLEIVYNWNDSAQNNNCALICRVKISPHERILSDIIFYTYYNFHVWVLNLLGVGFCRGECQVVKKSAYKKVGGYNNKIIAGEDFDFYDRLSKIGKLKYVKELVVYESPRRFRRYGYIRILWSWTMNFFSVLFLRKSVSKEWEPVR